MKAAIRDPNPVIVLENEIMYGQTFPLSPEAQSKDFILPIGKAKIERSGKDITFVTHSINVGRCLQVAEQLKEKHNVEAEVINIRSAKPLDVDCIVDSVKKTNRVVSVDSGFPAYVTLPSPSIIPKFCQGRVANWKGFGAEIIALVNEYCFDYLDAPPERVTGAEVPTPYAKSLEDLAFPEESVILKAAEKALYLS